MLCLLILFLQNYSHCKTKSGGAIVQSKSGGGIVINTKRISDNGSNTHNDRESNNAWFCSVSD